MTLPKKGTGPRIDHVTVVVSPAGRSVNSAMLCASNGRVKSSLMETFCGAGASIANAVYNACGVRVRDYPITPDKILNGFLRPSLAQQR